MTKPPFFFSIKSILFGSVEISEHHDPNYLFQNLTKCSYLERKNRQINIEFWPNKMHSLALIFLRMAGNNVILELFTKIGDLRKFRQQHVDILCRSVFYQIKVFSTYLVLYAPIFFRNSQKYFF